MNLKLIDFKLSHYAELYGTAVVSMTAAQAHERAATEEEAAKLLGSADPTYKVVIKVSSDYQAIAALHEAREELALLN